MSALWSQAIEYLDVFTRQDNRGLAILACIACLILIVRQYGRTPHWPD